MSNEEALRSDALECYKLLLEGKSIDDAFVYTRTMISYSPLGSYGRNIWVRVSKLLSEDLSLNFN